MVNDDGRGVFPADEQSPTPLTRADSWAVFGAELKRFMDLREINATELALRLPSGVSAATVRQWRRQDKPTHPPLTLLGPIANALTMSADPESQTADPLYLPQAMGIIPSSEDSDLVDLAEQASKLRSRVLKLSERLSELSSLNGVGSIVDAALASNDWAVAVWPAFDQFSINSATGTESFALHVADRIDFLRTDGKEADNRDIWRRFREPLDIAGAIHTPHVEPRWPSDPGERKITSHWSVVHVGREHPSSIEMPHPHLPYITVTSLTVGSWASDIAAHLAKLLGYGLTSTRDLVRTLYGVRKLDLDGAEMEQFHRRLIERPRHKRVWSHWSTSSGVAPLLVGGPSSTVNHVYIRSDDWSLRSEARRRMNVLAKRQEKRTPADTLESFEEHLFQTRSDVDAYIRNTRPARLITYNGELGKMFELDTARRSARFEQSFIFAAKALNIWAQNDQLDMDALRLYWAIKGDKHKDTLVRYIRNVYPDAFGDI
jgi:hypothetical protein